MRVPPGFKTTAWNAWSDFCESNPDISAVIPLYIAREEGPSELWLAIPVGIEVARAFITYLEELGSPLIQGLNTTTARCFLPQQDLFIGDWSIVMVRH